MLGWNEHAIFADGALVESVSEVLTISTDKSNNFGSFAFMPTLSKDEIVEAATWNAAQNVMYQFQASVLSKDAFDYYEALKNYAGTGLTLAGAAHEYPEQLPMMILAATDYSRRNATQRNPMNTLLEPKEITIKTMAGEDRTYILSKFPAIAGREIVSQYPISAVPKLGDYKINEALMLKIMGFVAVPADNGKISNFLGGVEGKAAAWITKTLMGWLGQYFPKDAPPSMNSEPSTP
ncbi:hypothetical protein CPC16_010966 [Podila verticillata]|nr:hypothetical protein CPC16_010966 [Podila verticillata]